MSDDSGPAPDDLAHGPVRSLTLYKVIVDLGPGDPMDVQLTDVVGYHAVLDGSDEGTIQVLVTLPADDLSEAVSTALSVVGKATGRSPWSVRGMVTHPATDWVGD